jgi:hypothetical protein
MTPDRFNACLTTIGWSIRYVADLLGVHETRARRWKTGEHPIPAEVEQWLEKLAAARRKLPPPVGVA